MAKINRKVMLILKIVVSLIVSIIALYQLIISSAVEDIIFWLLSVLFCVVNTIKYSGRDYEK